VSVPDTLITIGITCYREGDWLRERWESVLALRFVKPPQPKQARKQKEQEGRTAA